MMQPQRNVRLIIFAEDYSMVGTGLCHNINYVVFSTTLCLPTPPVHHIIRQCV
jgi:hypothetical protein